MPAYTNIEAPKGKNLALAQAVRQEPADNGGLGGDKKNANKFTARLFHKFKVLT